MQAEWGCAMGLCVRNGGLALDTLQVHRAQAAGKQAFKCGGELSADTSMTWLALRHRSVTVPVYGQQGSQAHRQHQAAVCLVHISVKALR